MKIAQLPKRRTKNNIVLTILIIGLPILLFATYKVVQIIINASADTQPKNVVVSDITTNSINISWITDSPLTGGVIVYQNGTQKSQVTDTRGSGRKLTHYVTVDNLEQGTTYDFTILSGTDKYAAQGGKKFTFTTPSITPQQVTPHPIFGSITMKSGDNPIIYAILSDKSTYPVSAVVKEDKGTWLIDLASLRSISDKSLVTISNTTSITIVAISETNRGAVVEGVYSSLFNNDGQLTASNTLALAERTDMYSFIPDGAKLVAYDEIPTPTPTPVPRPAPTPTPAPTPEPKEETFKRIYRIVHQLPWENLSTKAVSPVTTTVTGEKSVKVTNLTDTGFTVIWVSKEKEKGSVNYGTSKSNLNSTAKDTRDGLVSQGEYYVHYVDVSKLQPETTYYYEIKSGQNTYDNNGAKYSIDSFATLSSPPAFKSIKGKFSNMPSHGEGILIASIEDTDETGTLGKSLPIATLIGDAGLFTLTVSNSWSEDGTKYFEYTSPDRITLDIMTTFDVKTQTTTMKDVESIDIDVDLKDISSIPTSTSTSKIPKLTNYGIVGATDGSSLPVSNPSISTTSNENITATSGSIPKTGVVEDMIYALLASFTLIVVGSVIYFKSGKNKRYKGKMVNNL
ncbi:MAG: fibronectin type III domain-containing protein [Candidatus Dojkabacteria bacterium]|jgi:hypothetical protein